MSLYIKITYFLVLLGCAFGEDNLDLDSVHPCYAEDLPCIQNMTTEFLASTANGIPKFDIKPLDPFTVPLIEHDTEKVKYSFKNTKVVGMKNLNIEDFKMDTTKKTLLAKIKVDLKYTTEEINIDYKTSKPQSFSGSYDGHGKAIVTITYHYDVKADDKGIEHFVVGPETITCEAVEAHGNVEKSLQDSLNAIIDPEIQEVRAGVLKNSDKYFKTALCKLAEIYIIPTLVNNFRVSSKLLPKGAFLKNI